MNSKSCKLAKPNQYSASKEGSKNNSTGRNHHIITKIRTGSNIFSAIP
jgi:hypothetical protein